MPVLLFLAFRQFVFQRKTTEERLIRLFLNHMRQRGYEKKSSEGLEEFLGRIESNAIRAEAGTFVREFQKRFYKDRNITANDSAMLREMIHRIR